MGGMKRSPAGSEGSGRGPYVTALFYALGSVLVLFGELFSAEAESAYDSQADKDIADGAGNRAGGGVALRGLAIARLGGGDDRTGFGSGAVCGGPVVLCIATFFAIGSTCCQGAAFGHTLMPVVGTIAGPLGSPLVNMGGGDGEGARIYSKIYKAILNISHRQVIIIFDSNTHISRICGFLNFISNCYNLKIS